MTGPDDKIRAQAALVAGWQGSLVVLEGRGPHGEVQRLYRETLDVAVDLREARGSTATLRSNEAITPLCVTLRRRMPQGLRCPCRSAAGRWSRASSRPGAAVP
jgi:hypothetical protein